MARVRHPQTNGKIERFHGEISKKIHLFSGIDEFIKWHNDVPPHMSLNWDTIETPAMAFKRKMPEKGTTVIDAETGETYDVA